MTWDDIVKARKSFINCTGPFSEAYDKLDLAARFPVSMLADHIKETDKLFELHEYLGKHEYAKHDVAYLAGFGCTLRVDMCSCGIFTVVNTKALEHRQPVWGVFDNMQNVYEVCRLTACRTLQATCFLKYLGACYIKDPVANKIQSFRYRTISRQ